jgi:5-methylcytosine-specific restriction endonuclease McrA
MKFELNRPTDYSNEAILNEIRRVSLLIEKPLSQTKFDINSKYSSSTIQKKFGGWIKALGKAGLDDSFWYAGNIEITKDEIIKELKRVSEILGTTCFSQKDFLLHSHMDRNIISRKLGYFNKTMNEIGFTTPLKSRKYTDEERYENLLNIWTFYGRQPTYDEMKKEPSVVGPKAYVVRWGSWTNALIAFLEKINSDVSNQTTANTEESEKEKTIEKKNKSAENRRDISVGLRFTILKRDNYKCVLCGRSPATTLGLELHVDHIIPFSKGGKTLESNLRTLCNQCNIGKSDKMD